MARRARAQAWNFVYFNNAMQGFIGGSNGTFNWRARCPRLLPPLSPPGAWVSLLPRYAAALR